MTLEPLAELRQCLQRAATIATVADLLSWDEQVNLPPGAAGRRGQQASVLADLFHAAASRPRIGELLAELEVAGALAPDARIVVREARQDFDRATRLPPEYVREKARQDSLGYHAWAKAKAEDDFAGYAPVLEKNLGLVKREAGYLGWEDRPYDYMLDRHDPGMTADAISVLFAELKAGLVPLVRSILAAPRPAGGTARVVGREPPGVPAGSHCAAGI